jgi:chromosome partitioning protein
MDLSLRPPLRPYIVVLGNEKGGTGKSTLAMHLIVHLLYQKYRVGSIDVDGRQGTLSRYLENRLQTQQARRQDLPLPQHHRIQRSQATDHAQAVEEDTAAFQAALGDLAKQDFIVVDTPGSDTFLSKIAHSCGDTLITPLNDSFIDLDLLVRLDSLSQKVLRPSTYAETVWEQRKARASRDGQQIDWIVLKNRTAHLFTRNKEQLDQVLGALAKRIGFRLASGFGERVIFRELFVSGLTLLDLESAGIPLTLSHVAARQELRSLGAFLPSFEQTLQPNCMKA